MGALGVLEVADDRKGTIRLMRVLPMGEVFLLRPSSYVETTKGGKTMQHVSWTAYAKGRLQKVNRCDPVQPVPNMYA